MSLFAKFIKRETEEKRFSVLTIVLSVLLALGLWLYVVSLESPSAERTFDEVKIKITGVETLEESHQFTVLSGYDYSVSVTLRGRRSVLDTLTAEQIVAKVDVSDITDAGEYDKKIKFYPPSGTEFVSSSSEILSLNVDGVKTLSVPVLEPQATYTLKADVHAEYEMSPRAVSVTGPAMVVDQIRGAQCVLNLGEYPSGKITQSAEFVLVDVNGTPVESPYLRVADNRKVIVFEYSFYKEKEVPLVVEYDTALEGERVDVKLSPSTVTVKGAPEKIDALEEIVVHHVNTKDLALGENKFDVSVYSLPDGFVNVETGNPSVSYEFTATLYGSSDSSVAASYTARNVNVLLPENFSIKDAERMEFVFRTNQEVRSEMYLVELDLTGISAAGTYDVIPKVTVRPEWTNCCYIKNVGVIQVTVDVAYPSLANDA